MFEDPEIVLEKNLEEKKADKKKAKKDAKKKSFFITRNLKSNKKASLDNMSKLLSNNVVEIRFKRRIWPIKSSDAGQGNPWRRMLATSDWKFLQSNKSTFKFKAPSGARPRSSKWYKERNLVIVHDLVRQAWRMINLDDYSIISTYPIKTKKQQEEYIKYYERLYKKYGKKKLIGFFNR